MRFIFSFFLPSLFLNAFPERTCHKKRTSGTAVTNSKESVSRSAGTLITKYEIFKYRCIDAMIF